MSFELLKGDLKRTLAPVCSQIPGVAEHAPESGPVSMSIAIVSGSSGFSSIVAMGRKQKFALETPQVPLRIGKRDKPLNRVDAWLSPDSGTEMNVDLSAANLGCRPETELLMCYGKVESTQCDGHNKLDFWLSSLRFLFLEFAARISCHRGYRVFIYFGN